MNTLSPQLKAALREKIATTIEYHIKANVGEDGLITADYAELRDGLLVALQPEIERLVVEARIDEVMHIPYWGAGFGTEVFGYDRIFRDSRISAIKRMAQLTQSNQEKKE